MRGLETELSHYVDSLQAFRLNHELPDFLFEQPDHLGIKTADSYDFDSRLKEYKTKASEIVCVRLDRRLIASVHLVGSLAIGNFGEVEWVEIMEPRPEKKGSDKIGIDHVEFYQSSFEKTQAVLCEYEIPFTPRDNGGHKWLEVVFGDNLEVKFNDRTLADVVSADKIDGREIR